MAEISKNKILRNYLRKLKTFFIPKNILSFLLFLALSTAFWFTNALDKTRETEINIPLIFKGIPKNISISNQSTTFLTVVIKDQGVNLLSYSGYSQTPMVIELNQNYYEKGEITISRDQLKGRLSRYLQPTTTILGIKPDSISLKYEQLHVAKKTIKLLSSVDLAPQYILSKDISFSPNTVTVYGSKNILDTVDAIYTEKLEVVDLKDTLITSCKLKKIQGLKYSFDAVKVKIVSEMFTEKNINLPVTVINSPVGTDIRCFPAMIQATFNIGMSHFSHMNTNDIQLIFDYNQTDDKIGAKQKVKIKVNSKYISNVRIEPDEVEYIIENR